MPAKINLPVDEVVDLYRSGTSMRQLAAKYGVDRDVVKRHLALAGVGLRTGSEACKQAWKGLSEEERLRRLEPAWAGSRGIKRDDEWKRKAALGQAKRLNRIGRFEKDLAELLREKGLKVKQQHVVGHHAVDLVLRKRKIAIEVYCGGGPMSVKKAMKARMQDLFDAGYCVIIVALKSKFQIADPGLDKIADFLTLVNRLNATGRLSGRLCRIQSHAKPSTYAKNHLDGLPEFLVVGKKIALRTVRASQEPDMDELIKLYEQGEFLEALAERYNISAACVRQRLQRAGVTLRTRSEGLNLRWAGTSAKRRNEIAEKIRAGQQRRLNMPD